MVLIDRYVYAVVKSLPERQRGDIEQELRTLIDDMVEQDEETLSYENKVKKVLEGLGDPQILAENYRGMKRYLIGPAYYEKYLLVLKIVLASVFAGISIAALAGGFFSENTNVKDIILDYLSALLYGLLQAFAWITLGFAVTERKIADSKKESRSREKWSLSQLPKIPEKKSIIPVSEPIVSIIFSTIIIAILFYAPEILSAYFTTGKGLAVIPLLNMDVIHGYRALLICVFVLVVIKEVLKLYARRWTFNLSIAVALLGIASMILFLIPATDTEIWNPNFSKEIIKNLNLTFNFNYVWEWLKVMFAAVVVLAGVIESGTALYKGIRYKDAS